MCRPVNWSLVCEFDSQVMHGDQPPSLKPFTSCFASPKVTGVSQLGLSLKANLLAARKSNLFSLLSSCPLHIKEFHQHIFIPSGLLNVFYIRPLFLPLQGVSIYVNHDGPRQQHGVSCERRLYPFFHPFISISASIIFAERTTVYSVRLEVLCFHDVHTDISGEIIYCTTSILMFFTL